MLSFQEQRELIGKIDDYEFDENTLNEYIHRGNAEEQIYNKTYIIGAFKHKINLIDFSDEFIKLVKFYINFFIVNNGVYYYDTLKNKVYSLPPHNANIYDAFTDEIIISYEKMPTEELTFYVYSHEYKLSSCDHLSFMIRYDNPERLKDVDKLVIKNRYLLMSEKYKNLPYLETLSQALKNDDIDLFTDVCTQFPESINNAHNYKNFHCIRLFELTILFNAIKCFKYMVMNNYYIDTDKYYYIYLSRCVAISNNFEIVRILENIGIDIFNTPWEFYSFIKYHRNDIIKYAFLKFPFNEHIGYCFNRCINSYNYDLMLYILENFDYIHNNSFYYGDLDSQYKHMPAILYTIDNYNLPYSANWLNIIPTLIKLPFSVDTVMGILKKMPSYICRVSRYDPWVNAPKTCLIACFRYNKPYEYIEKIVNFIYGSPKIEYNYMNWYRFRYNRWTYFTPLTVLDTLYKEHVDVDIIKFIKIMFYKGYDYNTYDLKMISLLMRRKANKNNFKKLATLLQYYSKQIDVK